MIKITNRTGLIMSGVVLALATGVHAELEFLNASQNEANPKGSVFGLDFAEQGGLRSDLISETDFQLNVDRVRNQARFVSYAQQVPSLNLPDGTPEGTDTGDITVTMIPGQAGTLEPNPDGTFTFTTVDDYLIEFTGDLSAYGIPGNSVLFEDVEASGTIEFDTNLGDSSGRIDLLWTGNGVLLDPASQEGGLLFFNYSCDLDVLFVGGCFSTAVCPNADVDCNSVVNGADLLQVTNTANFGQSTSSAAEPRADINGDGTVNGADVLELTNTGCFGL